MEIPTTEDDGNLRVDAATLMLKIHAEASKRSVKLCPPSELYLSSLILFLLIISGNGIFGFANK